MTQPQPINESVNDDDDMESDRTPDGFTGWAAAESYCRRRFTEQDMPPQVETAIIKADIAGYFTVEAQHLCDPYVRPA